MKKHHSAHKKASSLSYKSIFALVVLCFAIGALIGIFAAFTANGQTHAEVDMTITSYIKNLASAQINKSAVFRERTADYGKYIVIMWILGFVPAGAFAPLLFIGFKGASFGYSAAALVRAFELKGLIYAAILFLFQNAVLIPAYCFMAYCSVNFIFYKRDNKTEQNEYVEYLLVLFICIALVVAASLVEAYILPGIIKSLT